MDKITVKQLIEFRNRSERSRKTLIRNLSKKKEKIDDSGGGDYWTISLSAIANVYKFGKIELLNEKIDEVVDKKNKHSIDRVKNQYQRNIDILDSFNEYDFESIRPNSELKF